MTNVRKRISELTALTSASLDTTLVGVDGGTTYKIELDTLADAVTSRVNILDRDRLNSLESVTSSFETKGRSVISSSAQITTLGFISTSVDISYLNSFTSSQNTLNTTFTNGISARLQTSSFNDFSSSVNQRILDATNEQSFNGLISGSSQLTSSYDERYVLSGSITQTTWDNIANKPSGIVSQSTDLSSLNSFTSSQSTLNTAFQNGINARLQTSSFNDFSASVHTEILAATNEQSFNGLVSGSSQLPTLATTGSNTFTGTNTFNNIVTIGGSSGAEGGELRLAYAETGNTLTGSAASIDIYQNRLRIFEGGGNARGAHLDLSKLPEGVAGELVWKVSGFVDAGTFVTLDNLKCTVTTSANRGLSIAAVSTSFTANISGQYTVVGGSGGGTSANVTYTTTPTTSLYNWNFPTEGDGSQYQIVDKTNNRVYRVSLMIGASYLNNFISIERLF
jgi:hypothetical protein